MSTYLLQFTIHWFRYFMNRYIMIGITHIATGIPSGLIRHSRKLHVEIHEYMVTSSNGNNFRFPGPLCGELTGHRWIPRAKASDAELWCFLWSTPKKRLSKQSWGWWFETPSCSLWRHCNVSEQQSYNVCLINYEPLLLPCYGGIHTRLQPTHGSCNGIAKHQWPLLLKWINFDHSMDK